MKEKKIKIGLFQNAKIRIILAAITVVGIAIAGIATWHASAKRSSLPSEAAVSGAPVIESIPGAGESTAEYAKQQDIENATKSLQARNEGTSNVPTINRGTFVGPLDAFGKTSPAQCPLDPKTLPVANPNSCTTASLQRARDAGVQVLELRCKGCTCPALKAAGYTIGEMKTAGYDAKTLRDCGFSLTELKQAGFSAAELKDAGFSAEELRAAGFSAAELKAAGFSATELRAAGFTAADLKAAGFSADELRGAGFSDAELAQAGFITHLAVPAGKGACSPEALKKARSEGVSAQALRAKGCGLAALKAAGFTAAELRAAGFSAKQLKDVGFSAAELKAAGFSAGELRNAGFSAAELKAAGYSASELKAAGFSAKELKAAGFTAKELKDAGFSAADLLSAGFTPGQLKEAGFSAAELLAAGVSPAELRAAGYSADELRAAGVNADDMKTVGFSKGDLLRAGFTPSEAGYVSPAPAPAPIVVATPESPASASMPKIDADSPADRLAELERLQQERMSKQQRQDMIMQQQGAMAMQAQRLLGGWSNFTQQSMEARKDDPAPSVGVGQSGSANSSDAVGGDTVKAGTILFAVLDTSINSDEKGTPVMARIVGGTYKGGKLLGKFSLVDKRLMLTFNLLSLPDRDKSISINAVAIDPDTARTALTGDVDNHYLLRYGTLFASAFVSGVADAISNSGSTQEQGLLGPIVTRDKLGIGESALVGVGEVGKKYSSVLSDNFTRQPTVTIAGGTGMGLLIMADTTIPGPSSK